MSDLLWTIEQALVSHLKKDEDLKKLVRNIYRIVPISASLPLIKLGKTNFDFKNTIGKKYCYMDMIIEIYTQEENSEIMLSICDSLVKSLSKDIELKGHKIMSSLVSAIEINDSSDGKTFLASLNLSIIIEINEQVKL